MKILIVEDDPKILKYLKKGFNEASFTVDTANDGPEGLSFALTENYDTIILDIMLPGIDGFSILKRIRSAEINTPILILSAKRSVENKIQGLEIGADDYLIKPFSFSELLARVHALMRRNITKNDDKLSILKIDDLSVNLWSREVKRNNKLINLQAKEFSLLTYFIKNKNRVISKTSILEHVYDYQFDPQTNVVDVLVHRLRSKIDKEFNKKLIHTIRGVGYCLKI